ncbi:Oxidoreductase family, NAD-binding Rossmann fold [Parapedobacter composti]|uniref:Oxidoreductase family, NAD-binding Rossmann fold n=1 Tax=Parapedobacter composti TaxID=623281 RepID=A0A1I1JB61_9SPHI|nr:Gfo/Idh/MocA family oxidoreductase [Parapedobacter composti]SFC43838.1 Oxidoreductase family, NAD-binding Rossmann fold [Parapedobacter composti]
MSYNRRNFLKSATLLTGTVAALPSVAREVEADTWAIGARAAGRQRFNMSGYAAPRIDKVRIGFIGLGMRGPGAVHRMSRIEGIEIKALCDKDPAKATKAQDILAKAGLPKATEYSGDDGWKDMVSREDLDLVYICTPWDLHAPMAVFAMKQGKHVACEVPLAITIDECWELVETSEKTKKHCMMLENCCYDFFEMLTLNMARNGLFGEIVHAEGAYIHDLLDLNFKKDGYADMWRLRMNATRNGNLYPTHGLGPIAQCLGINRGDKMDYLVSMSTNDFMMGSAAAEKAREDDFFQEFAGKPYRGNMNTTLIHTAKGKTMMVQHDVTSPRPYSRIHLVSGTKGVASKWPSPERIAFGHSWVKEEELKDLYDKYTPALIKHVGEVAKQVGGHGGMDFVMDWRLIDCLRNGLPLDQDVYDGALWSCIFPLSEKSVAKRSRSLDVPDFTRGAWKTNKPVDLTLEGGATTSVRQVS